MWCGRMERHDGADPGHDEGPPPQAEAGSGGRSGSWSATVEQRIRGWRRGRGGHERGPVASAHERIRVSRRGLEAVPGRAGLPAGPISPVTPVCSAFSRRTGRASDALLTA